MSYSYRETALNWLALGLLLAAWNAADDGGAAREAPDVAHDDPRDAPRDASQRPAALRGYALVSVRAVARTATVDRGSTHAPQF